MAFIIAVDGPAASGKGTVASRLAKLYDYPMLDTGLLYRAVGVRLLDADGDPDDPVAAEVSARELDISELERPEVRTRAAGEAASRVAVHPGVRAALFDLQRDFALREPGCVIDGRDIGTVIAPEAPAKLYVSASPEVRADRRWKQLLGQGESVTLDEVLADIRKRDERDGGRASAPMTQAPDAVLLDTSEMTIEQAFDAARRIVETARARWGNPKG
uniref:Cytidylate kinase n=1 Tax=Caulobacter sp. (strain K31) TaxID=366602 RepID=KCY_CAUSK|nr:RecName: Full=Cytidylate kinase; Short=CK; AltName: Full=Cytidine monophosphate kinase; Short=CMP kinase [Caulobacter sp. K31]